eukprot:2257797-Pyramimonas_sp.AAC.1
MGVEKVEGSTARYGSNREAAPRARSTIRCATSVSLRDQARSLNGNTPHPLGLTGMYARVARVARVCM